MNKSYSRSGLLVGAFEKTVDGKQTGLYILKNKKGSEVTVTNYGAKIASLLTRAKDGSWVDVVLGHNTIDEYLLSEEPYFGAVCGRTANRISRGRFELDGVEYKLATNNGKHSLHGGIKGFNAVVWDVKAVTDQSIELFYLSPDGEEGYPGNLSVTVTYTITDDDALDIRYHAVTDKATVVNLTNHSYFNLSGHGDPYIGDHVLMLNADNYLTIFDDGIPTGKPATVKWTLLDFTTPHAIGERIDGDCIQLFNGKGYDHNYILNKPVVDKYVYAGSCFSPKTGIKMEIYTTEPGIQLYTGNWMTGSFVGKGGMHYPGRSAVCLETQHFPDSTTRDSFPTVVLRPGEVFESRTTYRFLTEGEY
jgi:aldose 1-epimerase